MNQPQRIALAGTAPQTPFEVRRGRPAYQMTPVRQRVYSELQRCVSNSERLTMAELARRCRLHDYRDARRVVTDLKAMGLVA